MKNKTKVEIIQPFIDGQEKGDINYMNPDDAKRYHEYGAVKIIEETKKPTQKKEKLKKLKVKILRDVKAKTYKDEIGKELYMDVDMALNYEKKGICEIIEETKGEYQYLDKSKSSIKSIKKEVTKKFTDKEIKEQENIEQIASSDVKNYNDLNIEDLFNVYQNDLDLFYDNNNLNENYYKIIEINQWNKKKATEEFKKLLDVSLKHNKKLYYTQLIEALNTHKEIGNINNKKYETFVNYANFFLNHVLVKNTLKFFYSYYYSIYFKSNDKDELYIIRDNQKKICYEMSKTKLKSKVELDLNLFFNIKYTFKDFFKSINEVDLIKRQVFDLGFKPILEEIEFKYLDKMYINTYKPNKYLIKSNFEDYSNIDDNITLYLKKYAPNIYYLISNLCNFKEDQINYFISWLSYKIQKPHDKIGRGIVLFGAESTGKDLFYTTIIETIFDDYCFNRKMSALDPKKNESNYNGYESRKIIGLFNECYYLPTIEDDLKFRITAIKKTINHKGGKQEDEQCFTDFIFCSNHDIPIKAGSKRLSYIKSITLKGSEIKATNWVINEYLPNYKEELKYLLNVLHYYNVDIELIRNNLINDELKEIQDNTKSLELKYLDYLNDFENLEDLVYNANKYVKHKEPFLVLEYLTKDDYISIELIYRTYECFLRSVGYEKKVIDKSKLLKNMGILKVNELDQKTIDKKRHRCVKEEIFLNYLYKNSENKDIRSKLEIEEIDLSGGFEE